MIPKPDYTRTVAAIMALLAVRRDVETAALHLLAECTRGTRSRLPVDEVARVVRHRLGRATTAADVRAALAGALARGDVVERVPGYLETRVAAW